MGYGQNVATIALALAFFTRVGVADAVPIGYVSFDNLIPGSPGNPGVNAFTIGNLTGDPSLGGFAVPPSFPVLTSVTFLNSSLELDSGGGSQTFLLGDIGPGFFSPSEFSFPDTQDFSSALFTATLDATFFELDGGGTFAADSAQISVLLAPSIGSSLVAGTDLTTIEVSNEASAVPEPSSLLTVLTLVLLLFWLHRRNAAT